MSCIPALQGGGQRQQTHSEYEEGPRGQGCDQTEEPGREVMKRVTETEREKDTYRRRGRRGSQVEAWRQTGEGCAVTNQGHTHLDGETQREAEAAIRRETE